MKENISIDHIEKKLQPIIDDLLSIIGIYYEYRTDRDLFYDDAVVIPASKISHFSELEPFFTIFQSIPSEVHIPLKADLNTILCPGEQPLIKEVTYDDVENYCQTYISKRDRFLKKYHNFVDAKNIPWLDQYLSNDITLHLANISDYDAMTETKGAKRKITTLKIGDQLIKMISDGQIFSFCGDDRVLDSDLIKLKDQYATHGIINLKNKDVIIQNAGNIVLSTQPESSEEHSLVLKQINLFHYIYYRQSVDYIFSLIDKDLQAILYSNDYYNPIDCSTKIKSEIFKSGKYDIDLTDHKLSITRRRKDQAYRFYFDLFSFNPSVTDYKILAFKNHQSPAWPIYKKGSVAEEMEFFHLYPQIRQQLLKEIFGQNIDNAFKGEFPKRAKPVELDLGYPESLNLNEITITKIDGKNIGKVMLEDKCLYLVTSGDIELNTDVLDSSKVKKIK